MKKLSEYLAWKYFKAKKEDKEYWFNLYLKTYFKEISLLCFFVILISCGGVRKVETEKVGSVEVNNSYSNGSKIVIGTNITFTPFDNAKPFKVDGKEYENVIVSSAKNKTIKKWNTKIIYRTKTIYQTKTIERKDNTILYLGLFFIFALFVFLWFKLKK